MAWRSLLGSRIVGTHYTLIERDNDICVISPQRMTLDSWSRITMKRWTSFISQLYQKSYSRYRSASAISRLSLSRISDPRSHMGIYGHVGTWIDGHFTCVYASHVPKFIYIHVTNIQIHTCKYQSCACKQHGGHSNAGTSTYIHSITHYHKCVNQSWARKLPHVHCHVGGSA
jgi:hypothetical protein